jgi:hypothetical protein
MVTTDFLYKRPVKERAKQKPVWITEMTNKERKPKE